jgi:hypothetical protein
MTWKTFFARSRPIVVISPMDGSRSPPSWHVDTVRGPSTPSVGGLRWRPLSWPRDDGKSFPCDLLKREYIAIVKPVLFLTVMTGYYRLARLRISLLPPTRIRRDRNPLLGFMAHGPEIKFARDRLSKLPQICDVSHGAFLLWNAFISAIAAPLAVNRSIAARLRFPSALHCSRKRLFRHHALAFRHKS